MALIYTIQGRNRDLEFVRQLYPEAEPFSVFRQWSSFITNVGKVVIYNAAYDYPHYQTQYRYVWPSHELGNLLGFDIQEPQYFKLGDRVSYLERNGQPMSSSIVCYKKADFSETWICCLTNAREVSQKKLTKYEDAYVELYLKEGDKETLVGEMLDTFLRFPDEQEDLDHKLIQSITLSSKIIQKYFTVKIRLESGEELPGCP